MRERERERERERSRERERERERESERERERERGGGGANFSLTVINPDVPPHTPDNTFSHVICPHLLRNIVEFDGASDVLLHTGSEHGQEVVRVGGQDDPVARKLRLSHLDEDVSEGRAGLEPALDPLKEVDGRHLGPRHGARPPG